MKNKFLKMLSFILVLTSLFSVTAFAENDINENKKPTFKIGSATLKQASGKTNVSLPITFEGEINLVGLQLQVSVESGVDFLKFTQADIAEGIEEPATGIIPVTMVFIDITLDGVLIKNCNFGTLEFAIPTESVKDFKILLTVQEAINKEFENVADTIAVENGIVRVVEPEPTGGTQTNEPQASPSKPQVTPTKPQVTPTKPQVTPDESQVNTMTSEERKKDVICMKIGKGTTITYGKKQLIDEKNPNVVPYIKEDRTMAPLRFVSEQLGADVLWESGWNGCIVKKGNTEIKFTFGSAEFFVNGKSFVYDAQIEIIHDRTMVPVRLFAEHLGCDVYWEKINSLVIISPLDNPWVADRNTEISAVNEMLISILGIL